MGPPGPQGPSIFGATGPRGIQGPPGPPGMTYEEASSLVDKLLSGLAALLPPKSAHLKDVSINVVPVAEAVNEYAPEAPTRAFAQANPAI
jgi:hypothetical protein